MSARTRLSILALAAAAAFAALAGAPDAPAVDAQTATDNTPTPDVIVEAYTEAGGAADDGDDTNDIAAFGAPSASPSKRAGESLYIQVTDLGPDDGDADPPEAGSVATLFRFSVDSSSSATGTFKSGGGTSLSCRDGRACDLDSDSDDIIVQFDIADDVANNSDLVISVVNINDNKTVRVTIEVTGAALAGVPDAPAVDAQTATDNTPTAPSDSSEPWAAFYGGGLRAGDVVTASIGGVECGEAAADASGGWAIRVDAGGCGGGAVDGATIAFAVNGRAATPTATWRPGGVPDDVSNGITLTVDANPRRLPAYYYGGGLRAGAVVTASIGGVECGKATADASGGWSILVAAGGCGGRAAAGAVVAFAINGRAAWPTVTWEAGGLPAGREDGITLTAGMRLRLGGARAVYAQGEAGGYGVYVVGAPDFVNAAFAGRWVVASAAAATPPTLTLDIKGARAVYVQDAEGVFASYVVGAPDFVNAAFVQRWIAGAPG